MAIRKKKTNYTPWLIGLGAAGVIGYLFRKEIKNLITGGQNEDFIPDENIVNPVVIENIVTPGGNVAVKSEITKGLSPLGTSKGSLNMDQALKFGDKGQEVAKMQQILNRIAEITKKAKLTEDGIFGQGTQARLSQMFGNTTNINLFKLYVALWAIWAADKAKTPKKWFSIYQTYLTSSVLRNAARDTYFKNNTLI
jgi:hypothetical protein